MGKKVLLSIDEWNRQLITSAIEAGVDAIVCPREYVEKIKSLGRLLVIAPGGDLVPEKDIYFIEINSPEDFQRVSELIKTSAVCLDQINWNIIAVENLVALLREGISQEDSWKGLLFVRVSNEEQLKLALGILERGVSGVVIKTRDISELKKIVSMVKAESEKFKMEEATIQSIKPLGLGDRVCVDTALMLDFGEGLLVGNSSSFMFLVHGENVESPYVEPRPFRVNAGGVHSYVRVPKGKTKYLSELKAGDTVLVVSHRGISKEAVVGRLKIERRPLVLITATFEEKVGTIILQNAETIRLVSPEGKPLSVATMREGDRVVVFTETKGRHFGLSIDETIWEK